ncbi:unnamed protein product [Prunus armeniaca]
MDFWLKDGIAPVSHSLSLSRASLSLSSGSRPPPQPATFWPAVHSSGHHSGRDRSQNDRPDSAVLPHPFSDVSRQRYRRKLQKTAGFYPNFPELVPAIPATKSCDQGGLIFELDFGRISRGDSGHFRKLGRRFGVFRPPEITQGTHPLPARGLGKWTGLRF